MSVTAAVRFNARSFSDKGILDPAEYAEFSQAIVNKLNGLRINAIRKWLYFTPYTYDKYLEAAKANFDRKNAPIASPGMALDFEAIPFFFTAKFNMTYWADFVREYFYVQLSPDFDIVERTEQGYLMVPSSRLRSVVLAKHQLEDEVRKRWDKIEFPEGMDGMLEMDADFFIPGNQDLTETQDMLLLLELYCIP